MINVINAKKDIINKLILKNVKSVIHRNALNVINNQMFAHLVPKIYICIKRNVLTSVQKDFFQKNKMILMSVINVTRIFAKNVKIQNNTVQNVKTIRIFCIRENAYRSVNKDFFQIRIINVNLVI